MPEKEDVVSRFIDQRNKDAAAKPNPLKELGKSSIDPMAKFAMVPSQTLTTPEKK